MGFDVGEAGLLNGEMDEKACFQKYLLSTTNLHCKKRIFGRGDPTTEIYGNLFCYGMHRVSAGKY